MILDIVDYIKGILFILIVILILSIYLSYAIIIEIISWTVTGLIWIFNIFKTIIKDLYEGIKTRTNF